MISRITRYLMLAAVLAALLAPVCMAQNVPYAPGERVKFVINYKWGIRPDIATVDLSLKDARDGTWHAVADVQTNNFFDAFYKIRDIYECKFIPGPEVMPVWYHRDVHESKYWAKGTYTWDSADPLYMHAIIDKSTRPHRDTIYNEPQVIHDVINLLYFVRAYNIGPERRVVKRYMIVDRDIMEVRARYICNEKKKVSPEAGGTYNTRKIAIAIRSIRESFENNNVGLVLNAEWPEGEQFGSESIFLWLSDDANRIPVYFTAPLKVGSINGILVDVQGTKNPITSIVISK